MTVASSTTAPDASRTVAASVAFSPTASVKRSGATSIVSAPVSACAAAGAGAAANVTTPASTAAAHLIPVTGSSPTNGAGSTTTRPGRLRSPREPRRAVASGPACLRPVRRGVPSRSAGQPPPPNLRRERSIVTPVPGRREFRESRRRARQPTRAQAGASCRAGLRAVDAGDTDLAGGRQESRRRVRQPAVSPGLLEDPAPCTGPLECNIPRTPVRRRKSMNL